MRRITALSALVVALLYQGIADAAIVFPTNPALSLTYGDFTVYSLPFLENYYTKNGLPDPSQFHVPSGANQIGANRPAIVILSGDAGRANNNDIVPGNNADDAEDAASGGVTNFRNYLSGNGDPNSGPATDSQDSWDISVSALQDFLNDSNSNLNFFFNLNEQGEDEGLLGVDMLGWLEVQLTGADPNDTVSYFLGGRSTADGAPSGPYDHEPTILTDPNATQDTAWAYIHGYIHVDPTTGEFEGFGKGPNTAQFIKQNIGADTAAFAFNNEALQKDLYSGKYDTLRVKIAENFVDNGFEQIFILATGDRVNPIPEPMSFAVWFGLGGMFFIGRAYRRRRQWA